MLEITESEMIERYIDGLKKASSRAEEFTKQPLKERPRLFFEFIEALKIAAGSAHQLAHAQQNTKFLSVRDIIEGVITVGQTLPLHSEADNQLWLQIRDSLDKLVAAGRKMATSRAMTRSEVLTQLDFKAENLPN